MMGLTMKHAAVALIVIGVALFLYARSKGE